MKIRDTCLDDRHAFITPALTWTFPINIVDPVTEFKVCFECENNPLGGIADDWFWPEPMPYMIEEIAIVDGSEVIFALNGAQAFAMSCFDLGYAPYHTHNEMWGRSSRWVFPIHFGRSLTDPNWIFNPRAFRNPQMRITWNSEWLHADQEGTHKVDSDHPIVISIWAKIMEEGASPVGYLMTKEVKEYTPTGPGDEITWLPTDFPHRKLMVRSYQFGAWLTHNITHLKLSQDQDKWIPFDLRSHDFMRLEKNWFEEVIMHGFHWVDHDCQREHLCGDMSHGQVCSSTARLVVAPTNWLGNTFFVYASDDDGTFRTTSTRAEVWSRGVTRTPLDCVCYPFGDQGDPEDWLSVAPMGNLRLILTHAAEDWEGVTGYGLTQVVSQQAHPY